MKSLTLFFVIAILGFTNTLFGQSIGKEKSEIDGQACYYYSTPASAKVKGVLILLPSFGEKARSIFDKISLPKLLADQGYLTIIPEINNTLFADQYTIDQLNQIIKTQAEKYNVSNFVIGGLSSGGAVAVGYTEYRLSKDTSNIIKGVFAIDSPLDLARLYASAERKINYSCHGVVMKEGYSIKNQFDRTFGGSPVQQPAQYLKYSSYTANSIDGGNAKFLKNIPIRLYCEPDLDFVKRTYCTDLQIDDINAFDLESISKYLTKIGSNKSEYITTSGKGFHSWNIIEPNDCADWILRISK